MLAVFFSTVLLLRCSYVCFGVPFPCPVVPPRTFSCWVEATQCVTQLSSFRCRSGGREKEAEDLVLPYPTIPLICFVTYSLFLYYIFFKRRLVFTTQP